MDVQNSTLVDHRVVTANDKSALVLIIALFLMVTFVFSVVGRVSISYTMTKSVTVNDWIIIGALGFGVAQTAIISSATNDGLGKKQSLLSQNQVLVIIESIYASEFLLVAAIALSKVSLLLLLRKLAVQRLHKRICYFTNFYVAAWALAAIITVGLRCGGKLPWNAQSGQCVNNKTLWIGLCPFDLLSELVIVVCPVLMMAPVQVPTSKKLFVCAAFASRLLFAAAVITRICFMQPNFEVSDFTLKDTNTVLATQIVLCLAITTACIPAMKPLMEAFNSGGMIVRVRDGTGNYGTGSASRSATRNTYNLENMAKMSSRVGQEELQDDDSIQRAQGKFYPSANHDINGPTSSDGRDSISSLARSEQMIIKKDVQWTVHYDDGGQVHRISSTDV